MFLFYFNNFYYLLSEVSYLQTQSVVKKIENLGHMSVLELVEHVSGR